MEPRKPPKVQLASEKSKQPEGEQDHATPTDMKGIAQKTTNEAKSEKSLVGKAKAVGREADRLFGGEYERREDAASRKRPSR